MPVLKWFLGLCVCLLMVSCSESEKERLSRLVKGVVKETSREKLTTVSIDNMVMDFGSFPMSERQERSFVLTNTGDNLLVIQDIITSCGCTKVEYLKEPVRPNGTREVKVIYEAEETGYLNKTIKVYCNVKNSPLRLILEGNVE